MARKRTARREHGQGSYSFDKKTRRHEWTIEKDGRRYRVRDRDEARARAQFEELRRKLFAGVDVEGGRILLREYLPAYIRSEVAGRKKTSTAHDYQKRADYYILPTLGDHRLCDLKRPLIVTWVNAMLHQTEWSLNSIRQALRLLQRTLRAAVHDGLIEVNPAADVDPPDRRPGDEMRIDDDEATEKVFSPEQVTALLTEVERTNRYHGLHPLYLLATRLGLRRGELLGLRWKDIDFDTQVITVRQQVIRLDRQILVTKPKTESAARSVPFPDDIAQMLRAHRLTLGPRGREYVFPNEDGKYRRPDGIDQHFRRVCKRLGFVGYAFHSLRKYAITDWRTEGVDLEVAAALAGHKGVKVTAETYSQATMERKRAAVEGKKRS